MRVDFGNDSPKAIIQSMRRPLTGVQETPAAMGAGRGDSIIFERDQD